MNIDTLLERVGNDRLSKVRTPAALKVPLPPGWDLIGGADTGTYMSATFTVIPPGDDPIAIVIEEFPNYRYISHEIELLDMSTPEWARNVYRRFRRYKPDEETCGLWADPNTQFRAELRRYKLSLRSNKKKPEYRVSVAREYMQAQNPMRLWFAPWLVILPYEIEHAKWPEETTGAGSFMRIKKFDHTLDTMEHALSRRPRSRSLAGTRQLSFLEQHLAQFANRLTPVVGDPHLGVL